MKTIIAGSRTVTDYQDVLDAIKQIDWKITRVLSGAARGADELGERWARSRGIHLEFYYPNWERYGKQAGIIRNSEMAKHADALIALWDGESRGTKNMIDTARKKGLRIYVHMIKERSIIK